MLSKIRESLPPERRPFGSRPLTVTPGVSPNLCAGLNHFSVPRSFLRELSKPIELLALCQPPIFVFPVSSRGHPILSLGFHPIRKDLNGVNLQSVSNHYVRFVAQSFQTATSMLEPARGSRRISSPGLAMACSLKDSLQGFRGMLPTSPDPTNQLPTSHSGQAQRPPGGFHRSFTACSE